MKNFNADNKLQQAAVAFIVRNLPQNDQEIKDLRKIFMEMNENGDGHLIEKELGNGLAKLMPESEAREMAEKLLNALDFDDTKSIEYEEFLRACLNKEKIFTEQNLKAAFLIFDQDNSGTISIEEIKKILSGGDNNINDEVWKEILPINTTKKDGEISFEEFKDMMFKIKNK